MYQQEFAELAAAVATSDVNGAQAVIDQFAASLPEFPTDRQGAVLNLLIRVHGWMTDQNDYLDVMGAELLLDDAIATAEVRWLESNISM